MMVYASARDVKINDKVQCVADAVWATAYAKMRRTELVTSIDIRQEGDRSFCICLRGFDAVLFNDTEIRRYAKSIGVRITKGEATQKEWKLHVEVERSDIIDLIGDAALLEQLAEECSELAQAALKMARKRRGTNPTPMTMEECKKRLTEEAADVLCCIKELHSIIDCDRANELMTIKRDRWEERIRAKESKK